MKSGQLSIADFGFGPCVKMPGGVWVKPHRHAQQVHFVVVKGTIPLGYRAKFDRTKTMEVKAGEAHFDRSDGACLIIGTVSGVWKTRSLSK